LSVSGSTVVHVLQGAVDRSGGDRIDDVGRARPAGHPHDARCHEPGAVRRSQRRGAGAGEQVRYVIGIGWQPGRWVAEADQFGGHGGEPTVAVDR